MQNTTYWEDLSIWGLCGSRTTTVSISILRQFVLSPMRYPIIPKIHIRFPMIWLSVLLSELKYNRLRAILYRMYPRLMPSGIELRMQMENGLSDLGLLPCPWFSAQINSWAAGFGLLLANDHIQFWLCRDQDLIHGDLQQNSSAASSLAKAVALFSSFTHSGSHCRLYII